MSREMGHLLRAAKPGERFEIGGEVEFEVVEAGPEGATLQLSPDVSVAVIPQDDGRVLLGIRAPKSQRILRTAPVFRPAPQPSVE